MSRSCLTALSNVVTAAQLHGDTVMIGGQAIVDWYKFMDHCGLIPPTGDAHLLAARATTDIDVLFLVGKNSPELASLNDSLADDWFPDSEQEFRYHWRQDPGVTLDLVAKVTGTATRRIEKLRISRGAYLHRARVVPARIIDARLYERCHDPELARADIYRLNHAGLVASKLLAVITVVESLRLGVREEWTERLGKDLEDLDRLIAGHWVTRIASLPPDSDAAQVTTLMRELVKQWTPHAALVSINGVDVSPATRCAASLDLLFPASVP